MNILTVPSDQLVFGVMIMVVVLTYVTLVSKYKIIGVINLSFCIALAVEFAADRPGTPGVALVMIGFVALGLFNGFVAFFGTN